MRNRSYDIVSTICKYHNKSIRLPNKHGYTCIYLAKNIMKDFKMLSLLVKYSTSSLTPSKHCPRRYLSKQLYSINSSKGQNIIKSKLNPIKKSESKKVNSDSHVERNLNINYTAILNKFYAYSYHNEDYHSVHTLSTKFSNLSTQQKFGKNFQPLSGLSGNRMDLNERESSRNMYQNIEQDTNEEIRFTQKKIDSMKNSSTLTKTSLSGNCENHIQINDTAQDLVSQFVDINPFHNPLKTENLIKNEDSSVRNTKELVSTDESNKGSNVECSQRNEDDSDDYYKMNSIRRGICLIVNNMMFWHSDFQNRSGCDVDEKNLEKVFGSFNFLVKLFRNLSAVICLMSHGTIGRIYGVDGNSLSIHELTSLFTADNCPSLAGKPKIFFIQACRGEDYQKGYVLQRQSIRNYQNNNELNNVGDNDDDVDNLKPDNSSNTRPRLSVSDAKFVGFKLDNLFSSSTSLYPNNVQLIPAYADFLLSYATVAGFRAQRDPTGGTVYIQALCKRLNKISANESLLDIVTAVHREVSKQLYQETSVNC
ncbi:unnamed protein product [Heterobilharzia americana]|nr:unnamed protein product [Heterobilharzia americana]